MQDVATGWVSGFRAQGHEVRTFNLGDRCEYHSRALHTNGKFEEVTEFEFAQMFTHLACEGLLADAMEWWPDVVFVVSCFFTPAKILEALRRRGIKVVLHLTESPYEDDNQLRMAAHGDLVLINDPTNLDHFREINPNTHYQPHGWNPDVHVRTFDPDAVSEFCFVGTGFKSRVEFLEQVDWSGIDIALAGMWANLPDDSPLRKYVAHDIEQCVDNPQAAVLYANTLISLNLYRVEGLTDEVYDGWSMGPREVELAALGTFFLRQSRPESDGLFPMLPTISGPDDFARKLRWFLAHPDERVERAAAAQAAVQDRSYHQYAAQLRL